METSMASDVSLTSEMNVKDYNQDSMNRLFQKFSSFITSHRNKYQFVILTLCILVLIEFSTEFVFTLKPNIKHIFTIFDIVISGLFLADFFVNMFIFEKDNKKRYFLTFGWLDLISSVPAMSFLKWGRLLKACKLIKAAKTIIIVVRDSNIKNLFVFIVLVALVVFIVATIAILIVESESGTIRTFGDAIWWAVSALTSVECTEHHPITLGGRIIAVVLMTTGMGIVSTFTGLIASWAIGKRKADLNDLKNQNDKLLGLMTQIAESQKKYTETISKLESEIAILKVSSNS